MSSHISQEVTLLLASCYGGLVLVLCYDVIRIIRRVFKASGLRVFIEDVIFWTVAAIFVFNIFLKYNYGTPRYFAIMTTLGTMMLFEWLLGRKFIDKIAHSLRKIIETLLKPLKKVWKVYKLKLTHRKKRNMYGKKKKHV